MSPDPTQEPSEETLNKPNLMLETERANNYSDSEDDFDPPGYQPLYAYAISDLPMYPSEDDEWLCNADEPSPEAVAVIRESMQDWSHPGNRSNIDMDADKIDQVKSMMATFTLPTTAIPEWAKTISEDQWKEQLIGRIKEMQNREK